MATLFNTKISDTYVGLLKTIDNAVITASLKELTDGSGNQSGLYLNTAGDFKVTSILEWGSLKDTGTGVTITQFVTASNGIQNFNNDTTVPTSAAVKLYVDTKFATSDTLAEVLVFGNTTSGRDIAVSANDDITFTDSSKAKFGASGDLEIYHNGSHSYIADVNTGSLYIQTNGSAIYLQDTDGKAMAQFSKGGGSFLMYNGNLKLGTSNTGVTVTGNILPAANVSYSLGSSSNSFLYTYTYVVSSAGDLQILTGGSERMRILSNGNVGIGTTNPDEKLRVDGNIKSAGDFIGAALKLGFAGSANITTNDTNENLLINPNGSGDILMQTTSTGNVGIGTDAPGTINGLAFSGVGLHVKAGTLGRTITEGTSFAEFIMNHSNASANQKIKYLMSKAGVLELGSMDDNGTRRTQVSILNNNNVGIGTTSPDYQLEVEKTSAQATIGITGGATDARLHLKTDNGNWMLQNDYSNNGALSFYNSGHRLVVTKDGKVGIGTTAPSEKLEVVGNVKVDGNVILSTGDNLYLNGTTGFRMLHDGSNALFINQTTGDIKIQNSATDKDIIFKGQDGVSSINALTLDMSEGGAATFAGTLNVNGTNITVANASNPYLFLNDTNGGAAIFQQSGNDTRIGSDSNTQVQFIQNNAVAVTINTSKNVGIGTTAPSAKLHVKDGSVLSSALANTSALIEGFSQSILQIASHSTGYSQIAFGDQDDGFDGGFIYSNASRYLSIETANSERLRIDSAGNVGIGTTAPTEKLHVDGNIRVNSGSQGLYSSFVQAISSTGLKIGNDDFSAFAYFHNDSNIGINTTSPNASSLLDVSSTTKGVLLPRMTTTQVNAISSPANGLTVYNTTLNALCFYNGTSWQKVTSANM